MKLKKLLILVLFIISLFLNYGITSIDNTKEYLKITNLKLFGLDCNIYLSKIYLAYIILLDHFYDCNWTNISKNFITNIRNLSKNINYDISKEDLNYLEILYKGPLKNETFFFNEIIFDNFSSSLNFNIPIKISFSDTDMSKSYDLLIKFYKKNYYIIDNVSGEISKILKSFFETNYTLNLKYNLNLSIYDQINILPLFGSLDLKKLGFRAFNCLSFSLSDDIYENYQVILHELMHMWYDFYDLSSKISEFNYQNIDEFISYVIRINETYKNLININLNYENKGEIIKLLNLMYINFDEFIAYEFSKYYCEKSFDDYIGLSFADSNKVCFDENTYLELKKLGESNICKNILESFMIDFNYKNCIKLFILYVLTIVKGFDYGISNYLIFIN